MKSSVKIFTLAIITALVISNLISLKAESGDMKSNDLDINSSRSEVSKNIKNKNERVPLNFKASKFKKEETLNMELTDIDRKLIILYRALINDLEAGLKPELVDETYTMAKIAFSINKIIDSYNGILFKLRRESDNKILDATYNNQGILQVEKIKRFCKDTNCYISTWFNQAASLNSAYQNSPDKQPIFNFKNEVYGIKFDTLRFFNLDDSNLINTVETKKVDFNIKFLTGTEVNTRQVIYEEGGNTDGLNIYIEDGQIYWSIWSQSKGWSYTYISTSIKANQEYSLRFHYDGSEGFLEAYLDGLRIKRVLAGQILAKHTANNGIGAQVEHSYYLTGRDSRMEDFAFKGSIMEFIYY